MIVRLKNKLLFSFLIALTLFVMIVGMGALALAQARFYDIPYRCILPISNSSNFSSPYYSPSSSSTFGNDRERYYCSDVWRRIEVGGKDKWVKADSGKYCHAAAFLVFLFFIYNTTGLIVYSSLFYILYKTNRILTGVTSETGYDHIYSSVGGHSLILSGMIMFTARFRVQEADSTICYPSCRSCEVGMIVWCIVALTSAYKLYPTVMDREGVKGRWCTLVVICVIASIGWNYDVYPFDRYTVLSIFLNTFLVVLLMCTKTGKACCHRSVLPSYHPRIHRRSSSFLDGGGGDGGGGGGGRDVVINVDPSSTIPYSSRMPSLAYLLSLPPLKPPPPSSPPPSSLPSSPPIEEKKESIPSSPPSPPPSPNPSYHSSIPPPPPSLSEVISLPPPIPPSSPPSESSSIPSSFPSLPSLPPLPPFPFSHESSEENLEN